MSNKLTLQSNNTELSSNNLDLQALIDQANALPDAGIELPELSNEGTAADLLSGKELIDAEGNKVTGTFNIDTELSTQDNLIAQIQAAVDNLPEAGGGSGANIIHSSYTLFSNAIPSAIWCEDGMTWEEYINSRYNIVGTHQGENYYECTIENNKIVPRTHSYYYISIDGTASGMVSLSDKIIADLQYMCYFDD